MADSGQKINYSLRPQKCVERKIMCELLSTCETAVPIHKYRYIGFGSFYFSDFVLFHNQLNINQMISIEKSNNKMRYEFNKPYGCIEMYYGNADVVLSSEINFSDDIKDIIWLDFDDALQKNMLSDLMTAVRKISSNSFLFTSFNTSILRSEDHRLDALRNEFGAYLPDIKEKDIDNDSLSCIIYDTVHNALQKALYERNVSENSDLIISSCFFVKYRDAAPMLTIGYFLSSENEKDKLYHSKASELPWFNRTSTPNIIKIPCLTRAEIREINRYLPGKTASEIRTEIPYLTENDISNYINIYKYYPNFLDAPYYT